MTKSFELDMSQPIGLYITDGADEYRITFDVTSFEHIREDAVPPEILQCHIFGLGETYAPGCDLTFCQAGCLVCSYCSVAQWAGYSDGPVVFAEKLANAGAFGTGQYVCAISRPHNITKAYPELVWHNRGDRVFYSPRYDIYETSYVNWEKRPGDRQLVANLLERFPVVAKVDYKPKTRPVEDHFVVLYKYIPDPEGGLMDDCLIMDPMTGYNRLTHYFDPAWWDTGGMQKNNVSRSERALHGLRILHPSSEGAYD